MTPLFLQDALRKDMKQVLSGLHPGGKKFRVYAQNLPPRQEDWAYKVFPFCRVMLGNGEDGEQILQEVSLVIGIRDENPDMQGHRDVMNAIQRIRERYRRDPEIEGGRYTVEKQIRWTLPQDTDTWPKFYGTVQIQVRIPGIGLCSDKD